MKRNAEKTVFIVVNRDKINFINRNDRKSVKVKAGNLKQFCLEIKEETGNTSRWNGGQRTTEEKEFAFLKSNN